MKALRLLVVLFVSTALVGFAAEPAKPAVKQAPCCAAAAKEGKKCDHKCCVEAAKEGKACEKCMKGEPKKGEGKKKKKAE